VPNHVISATDVPPGFAGRAIRCRRLAMVPVECIARGYLAGGAVESYRAAGTIHDVPLPAGLTEGSRLPEPVFTPTTKAPAGQHDTPMTFATSPQPSARTPLGSCAGSRWRCTGGATTSRCRAAS
jgi:phosphoribosylaminoimidazole-succinocarboxamide synthase